MPPAYEHAFVPPQGAASALVTLPIVEAWVAGDRDGLAAARVDPAALAAETARRAPEARPRAFALFDRATACRWDAT